MTARFMRANAVFALLLCADVVPASGTDGGVAAMPGQDGHAYAHPADVRMFDLHDPTTAGNWAEFVAATPMLNEEPVPPSLQNRLVSVVATYQALTPVDRPAFFVAAYFDLLSERLFSADAGGGRDLLPMRVCPVFASGADAPVTSLLALASGLPDEVFVNAPGTAERYRYLFLQTEFSHCRFLATIGAAAPRLPTPGEDAPATPATPGRLDFTLGTRRYAALLSSADDVRALVETVGDVDAIAAFRRDARGTGTTDEADVLAFVRLLSLLATHGNNGYAAVPVLFPLLSGGAGDQPTAQPGPLRVADALAFAYRARDAFHGLVPFPIRTSEDLLSAKLIVAQALADGGSYAEGDVQVRALLERFVSGSDILLPIAVAQENAPPIFD